MAKQISTTYGNALFELALEEGKMDQLLEEVTEVRDIFKSNEELGKLLNHPKIPKEEKITCIENIYKSKVSDELLGIMVVMIKKDRQKGIVDVFDYYERRYMEYKNIGTAYITSAVDLRDEQKKAIEGKLLDTTRYEKIIAKYKVDKAIIGGLVIRIEDRVVDSSIKTQIELLSKSLN